MGTDRHCEMLLTAYLDESGTHDASPISVMAAYLGTDAQWRAFDSDWAALLETADVRYVHAVDLFKRTKQFKDWPAERVNAFAVEIDGVIASHMPMGFSVIIRDDDYRQIYVEGPRPRRSRLDSKYGVCFRACLAFAPSFIASELQLAGEARRARETTINFVLEDGHRNVGDARRLFDLFKGDALPEWQHFVGTFDVSSKDSPGAQAADFLAYCVYRAELLEHGAPASAIEKSSYIADTPLIANTYPRQPVPQSGPMLFRIPVSQEVLRSLKAEEHRKLCGSEVDKN
jgi:Protein of unknown function (DUF3800)